MANNFPKMRKDSRSTMNPKQDKYKQLHIPVRPLKLEI